MTTLRSMTKATAHGLHVAGKATIDADLTAPVKRPVQAVQGRLAARRLRKETEASGVTVVETTAIALGPS